MLAVALLGASPDAETWRRFEESLTGVAATYYTEPDVDAMLRAALVAMVQQAPRSQFDSTSHNELYRVRVGAKVVASLPHPDDVDDVVADLAKVAEVLHRQTRAPLDRLVEAALRGAVMGLGNCYTVYLTAQTVQRLSYLPGEEPADVGISLECGASGRIRHVRAGSAAYAAGIEAGDVVRAVNGLPCTGLDAAEIYSLMAGKPGSRVRVGLTRTTRVDVTVELVRAARPASKPWMRTLADGKVLYLRPGPMGEQTTAELAPFLGCATRRGVLLDLRGNEGGRVDEAERFASLFLEPGPVASIEGRSHRNLGTLETAAAGPCSRTPVIVLVDGETASAAELIAQALRERRAAPLVGQPTFGKGSVQQFLRFSDGAVAKVTTARYLSPSGKPLDRSLAPDVSLPYSGVHLGGDSDPTVDPLVRLALDRLLLSQPVAGTAVGK